MDYNAFEKNVEANETFKRLPESLQADIKERADKLHEEMEEEARKMASGECFNSDSDC